MCLWFLSNQFKRKQLLFAHWKSALSYIMVRVCHRYIVQLRININLVGDQIEKYFMLYNELQACLTRTKCHDTNLMAFVRSLVLSKCWMNRIESHFWEFGTRFTMERFHF